MSDTLARLAYWQPVLAVDLFVAGALVAWLAFAGLYQFLARWRATEYGRNIMGTALMVAAVFALILMARLVPDYPFRWLAQFLVYGAGAVLAIQRTRQLVRLWRKTEADERAR